MKKRPREIIKQVAYVIICLAIIISSMVIFIPQEKWQSNQYSISQSAEEGVAPIKYREALEIANVDNRPTVTSRGNINRTQPIEYTLYDLKLNDKVILTFDKIQDAKECKNEILEKTIELDFEIEERKSYTNDISTEDEIEEQKTDIIKEYKKPETFYPTVSTYISSYYGNRSMGWHSGIDIAGSYADPIYEYKDGEVISACYSGGYGNMILVQHEDGTETRYAHLSSILVSVGEYVYGGEKIGLMGSTGNSTGNHLHFEMIINNETVNPYNYIF